MLRIYRPAFFAVEPVPIKDGGPVAQCLGRPTSPAHGTCEVGTVHTVHT